MRFERVPIGIGEGLAKHEGLFLPSLISLATQDWSHLLLPVFRDMPERRALPPESPHMGG